MNILMLVGSLRTNSWTAQLATSAAALLPSGVEARPYAGLGALPHYSEDLDTDDLPPEVSAFRAAVREADALVVATPEYNGSMPGVLKNAIDWASRPRGAAAVSGKPVAVLSVSPSPRGAQWAREEAVKVLRVAGAEPLEPAVGVASVPSALDGARVVDASVRRTLTDLMAALTDVVATRPAA